MKPLTRQKKTQPNVGNLPYKSMEKIDARKLSTEAQQEIRYQIIRLKNRAEKD